jgi:antitoxin VapB
MGLTIRDPRAAELAREIANRKGMTMTAVVINLLEREAKALESELTISQKLRLLSEQALAMAGPNRKEMTKEDIDALWETE